MKILYSNFKLLSMHEWRQLIRSRAFVWLTALLLGIGIYAIIYGHGEVKNQQQKIGVLQNDIDSLYKSVEDSLQVHDTTANFIGEYLGRLHANKPDGMAALAFGQRDIHKFAIHITNGSYFYNKYASGYVNKTLSAEITNPFKLLSGHLDISFVLLFLLPLYLILLTYNLFSSEKEGGTLAFLAVQPVPVSVIVFQKLMIRFGIAAAIGMLLLIGAAVVNHVLLDWRWYCFAGSFLAYLFCWAGLIALVISFKKPSGYNALLLVSVWILFTVLLPATLNAILNTMKPVATKTELSAAVQKANAEVWALPKPVRIDSFKTLRPYYAASFDSVGSWDDPKFYRINYYLTDYYIIPFEHKRIENVVARNTFADKLNYFSPVLLTQSIFNELSGSNMQQMLAFDSTGFAYFKQVSRFTDDYIFLKANKFTKNDLAKVPVMNFKPAVRLSTIIWQASVLLVAGIGLMIFYKNKMKI